MFRCKKIIKIGFFAFALSIFVAGSVKANGIFPNEDYYVPECMDMVLVPYAKAFDFREWSSDNPSVVSVDPYGVIHTASRGRAQIKAVDKTDGSVSTCYVNVTEPEMLRNAYVSRSSVRINDSFENCAITHKDVQEVRFRVQGSDYSREHYCTGSSERTFCKVWKSSFGIDKAGDFEIFVDCKVGGDWKNNLKTLRVNVNNTYDSSPVNLNEKHVSSQLSDFISSCEGSRSTVYADAGKNLTIGCGKKLYFGELFYNNLCYEEIQAYFMQSVDNGSYARAVNRFLRDNGIKYSQNQFDSLVSFSFNLGTGWINSGSDLKDIILSTCSGGGGELKGRVTADDALRLRESPNTSSAKLRIMPRGAVVKVLSSEKIDGSWYIVEYGGATGYCSSEFLSVWQEGSSEEKSLNNIDRERFKNEFLLYHHVNRKCSSGLLSRRMQELDIFFNSNYSGFDYRYYQKGAYAWPECARINL